MSLLFPPCHPKTWTHIFPSRSDAPFVSLIHVKSIIHSLKPETYFYIFSHLLTLTKSWSPSLTDNSPQVFHKPVSFTLYLQSLPSLRSLAQLSWVAKIVFYLLPPVSLPPRPQSYLLLLPGWCHGGFPRIETFLCQLSILNPPTLSLENIDTVFIWSPHIILFLRDLCAPATGVLSELIGTLPRSFISGQASQSQFSVCLTLSSSTTWHILFSPPCSHLPSSYPLHPNGLTLWSMLSFATPSALASSPSRRVEGVITVSPLHMNLPVGNFQRCERVFTCCNLPSISYCWWSFSSTSSTSFPRSRQ